MTARLDTAPESSLRLAATASALGCAQREVRRVVDTWGLRHVADVIELLTMELVSVALGAAGQAMVRPRYEDLLGVRRLSLRFRRTSDGLMISTWDNDQQPPRFKQPGTGHGDGSELYFVPMLAEAWDYFQSESGKVTWCEILVPRAGERSLPRRKPCQSPQRRIPAVTDLALLDRVRDGLSRLDAE